MRIFILLLVGFCLITLCPTPGIGKPQKDDDPLEKILSGDKNKIKEGKMEILKHRKEQIEGLLKIVNDTKLRTKNRGAMVAAIELLGELRAEESVPVLVQLLLFGKKGDIHDSGFIKKLPLPPDQAAPAVKALIKIGIPSLKPVTEQLVKITKETKDYNTLALHCLCVIKNVLGPELGKAYLTQLIKSNKHAAKSRFVTDGLHFMDVYIKVKQK